MRKYTTMAVIVTAILMLTMTVSSSANLFYPEDIEDHDSFYAVAPTMFQDINGTYWMGFIHIKDEERNIGICHSRDMVNWSDPIVVESNVYLHSSNIVFFQGQDGFYNLIYRECFITNPDASIDHMLIRSSNGRDWGDPAHISESGYTKSVIQLSSGGYRMASCGLSWIHCALSDDLYEWSYRIIEDPDFTNEASPSFPYLYQDSDGRILLTYTYGSADNEAPQQVYLMYSADDGITWTEPQRISDGIGECHSAITQDKDGMYWAVWESSRETGTNEIYIELKYSTSWDLLNWTGPERLLDHDMEKSLSNPEIRCMPNGRIFVVADYVEYPVHNGYYPSQIYLMEVQGDVDSDGHDFRTDRFPEDPAASKDSDLDGYPDEWNEGSSGENSTTGLRLDEFPDDPKEWIDRDEDGYGDNEDDRFPEDGSEWNDTDNDGCGDNSDEFPGNGYEWEDRDNDGRGDNMEDAFPNDPKEWHDTDGDMVGDNSDRFPYNYSEWEDSDLDGTGDNGDAFPLDRAASIDTDGDGYPDSWNPGMNERDTSTLLEIDSYPDDPERWEGADKGGSFSMILVWVLIVILVIVLIGEIVSFVAYKHIKRRRKDNTAIYGWKRQQGVNDFGKKEGEKKAF